MELLALRCQNCGGPLSVPASVGFVTCGHCGTELAVRRTESAVYTERLDRLESRTGRVEDEVESLRRRTAVVELDRQWEVDQRRFFVTMKDGRRLPTRSEAVLVTVMMAVGGLFIAGMGASMAASRAGAGAALLFVPVGIGFGLFGLFLGLHYRSRIDGFEEAEREYRRERERLLTAGPDGGGPDP